MDKTAKAKELIRYAEETIMTTEEWIDFKWLRTKRLVQTDGKYYFIEMVDGICTRIIEMTETGGR